MKTKSILFALLGFMLLSLASCSFETVSSGCPAYSHQNKMTSHGMKAQHSYHKRVSHKW